MINYNKINKAISKFVRGNGFIQQDKMDIEFGKEMYSKIIQIAAFVVNDVLWAHGNKSFAKRQCSNKLKNEYPFLTDVSIKRITQIGVDFWK